MALTPGTRLGPYEIVSALGAGGMGEVYKARDTRLDRTVAIKVLPEHVAADPELKQRFEREAKTISSLNHPHICTLHDVGSQDGVDFLVMEHLDGETLAQRLSKGALPLDQALQTAIQIADALDKAHRQGITHRDLKPGNIMLTRTGAKLLDFGLAKWRPAGAAGAVSLSEAPTVSSPLTGAGSILGTFQYMAPEQIEGQEADARTDIFAFGAVVYEMVTGKKAFEGKSQASLIAAILERDPPGIASLESMTPAALDYAVSICLSKDPDDRWQTARDLLRELKRIDSGTAAAAEASVTTRSATAPPGWRRALPWVAGVVVAVFVTGLVVWGVMRPGPQTVVRSPILLPAGETFAGIRQLIAISLDGRQVAYTGSEGLALRSLDALQATLIPDTEGAQNPFFSPDGQWVGFWVANQLEKVSVSGGASVTLGGVNTAQTGGASWGADDLILYGQGSEGIWQVLGAGGTLEQVIAVEDGDTAYSPQLLPGGEWVLFTFRPSGVAAWDQAQIVAQSLDTGERTVLINGGRDARYVSTGHLVYALGDALLAVPFDVGARRVTGGAVPLVEGVNTFTGNLAAAVGNFGVAGNGSLTPEIS